MGGIIQAVRASYYFDKSIDDLLTPLAQLFTVTFINQNQKRNSEILYFFLKPEQLMIDSFGFDREILCIYLSYPSVFARLFEQISSILLDNRSRLDQMVCVIISRYDKAAEQAKIFPLNNSDRICIVPFSESSLIEDDLTDMKIKKIFEKNMYKRDLFGVNSPLQTHRGFFGRDEFVLMLRDQIKNYQNAGVFGLRRIGKTSVLLALKRSINSSDIGRCVYFDCSNPAFYKKHWWECLKILYIEILNETDLADQISVSPKDMDSESAPILFFEGIKEVISKVPENRLSLMLDEIEWISFRISCEEHWNAEFLPFWQTMRSIHQSTKGAFTFIISGVNPKCVEDESIGGYDNPLFGFIKPHFLKPFDVPSAINMLETLGRYMGIKFNSEFYSILVERYSGHPFLIRHACSRLSELITSRPVMITGEDLTRYNNEVNQYLSKYIKQILNILAVWYPEEYNLVVLLANEKLGEVQEVVKEHPEYLTHLVGYGLLVLDNNEPKLSLMIVSAHLSENGRLCESGAYGRFEKNEENVDQIRSEISMRRNALEVWLRGVVKNGLRFKFGNKCMDALLSSLDENRRSTLSRYGYETIFKELYFKELIAALMKHWSVFQNYFSQDSKEIEQWLNTINKFRIDAHAKDIDTEELAFLRICFNRMEKLMHDS